MDEPTPQVTASAAPPRPEPPKPAEPPRLRQADLWTSDGRHIHVALTAGDENLIVSGHQDSVLVPVDDLFTHADDKGGQHAGYQSTEVAP